MPRVLLLLCALSGISFAAVESTLRFGTAEIDPGETAEVPVFVRSETVIHGFSLAFFYNAQLLTLEGFRINRDLVPEDQVRYSAVIDKPERNYAVLGILLLWDHPCKECGFPGDPSGEERCLGWLRFSTTEAVQPALYEILPQNGLGDPPISNTFSVDGGRSVLPSLQAGSVLIRNHNVLRVRSTTVEPGEEATVILEVSHKKPLGGIQVSLAYDNTLVRLRADFPDSEDPCVRAVSPCGLDAANLISPHPIEQFVLNVEDDFAPGTGRATCGMVFDYLPPFEDVLVPPGEGQTILSAHFVLLPAARPGTDIPIELRDDLGDPPVANKVLLPLYGEDGKVSELISIAPVKENGTIYVRVENRVFRRGFINRDGRVNIADAVTILGFLFRGDEEPPCLSAADVNDDGKVNIADAVFLLSYLFNLQGIAIPPPFMDCGRDPTPDSLYCLEYTPGCP